MLQALWTLLKHKLVQYWLHRMGIEASPQVRLLSGARTLCTDNWCSWKHLPGLAGALELQQESSWINIFDIFPIVTLRSKPLFTLRYSCAARGWCSRKMWGTGMGALQQLSKMISLRGKHELNGEKKPLHNHIFEWCPQKFRFQFMSCFASMSASHLNAPEVEGFFGWRNLKCTLTLFLFRGGR